MQRVMVALNQNAVKSLFGLQNESYFIGKSSHLLYTSPKEYLRTLPSRSLDLFLTMLNLYWVLLAYRRFYDRTSDFV
jgi:hypothetical protein